MSAPPDDLPELDDERQHDEKGESVIMEQGWYDSVHRPAEQHCQPGTDGECRCADKLLYLVVHQIVRRQTIVNANMPSRVRPMIQPAMMAPAMAAIRPDDSK